MFHCDHLQTERLSEPQGILAGAPEFTWALQSDRPGDNQTACELEVDRVAADGIPTPAWHSGQLARRIGEEVGYAGEALTSRTAYRWRVRAWDVSDQPGDWSAWATFATGVMAPDRIAAQWITGGGALRREFSVAAGLVRARAYVAGLGYYEFFCNHQKVSVATLAPSFTEFDRRVEYEVIDLTPHLKPGGNEVGFLLGDGWWRHGPKPQRERELQAICEIVLEYRDGRREVIGSDPTWQAATGPVVLDASPSPQQNFDGVTLDLGWEANGGSPAHMASNPVGELVPALLPPVRIVATLPAREVKRLSDSLLVVDFGQNFTGWVRFRAKASRGTRLVVRHAELLRPNGRLNPETLRMAKQTDTFLLAGHADGEVVEPRFLHHGFRYAEIEGPVATLDIASIVGCVIHTDLELVGEVTTSDARINWLLDAVRWTVRSNAMSVMTDVCQRDERRGWLMDGLTGLKAGTLFYDMDSLGRKWLEDMIDNQEADGSLRADTAPLWFPCKSVGWQRAIVLLPMKLYETYGDRRLLERAWPHMRRYADYLLANLKDDLVPAGFSRHPAEWLCVGRRHDQLADNALAIDVLRKVAEAGRLLGESDDETYDDAANRIAAAAHRNWYDSVSAGYAAGEGFAQSSQVYALRFGITPPAERQRVFDRLVDDLMNARGAGPFVTTGIGSTEHLPIVLSEFGRDDLVWQWLQRDAYPGYGFMQQHGATAIWERWEQMTYHQMNAHNHTGLTGIGTWLMQYLVGIRTEPGPEPVIHLRPALHLPLKSLTARWRSRWGEVTVKWGPRLTIAIPPGCIGKLQRPGTDRIQELTSGHHEL